MPRRPPRTDEGAIPERLDAASRRMDLLEQPDRSQLVRAVQKITDLVNGLIAQVNGIFSGYITAGTTVSAGGSGTFAGGVNSADTYSRLVSYTGYKVQYIASDGWMGYVPSSRRFKQDIADAHLNIREIMPKLRVVTFRYINAVANLGATAAVEWGVIAEEVHDLGLYWLVDYDEAGHPEGVKHERFAILLILDAQEKQDQLDNLSRRMDVAGF